jgi:uncharacterized protein YtpQ (UPF0354 family)
MNSFLSRAVACVKASALPPAAESVSLPEADSPVFRDIGNGLYVVYLVDTDGGLVYVQNRDFSESSMTPDAMFEIGLRNLVERSNDNARLQQYGPIFGVFFDGVFEASLILRDDLWDKMFTRLAPNGFVAALPARDTLAVCDAGSKEGIERLRAMNQRAFTEGKQHLLTQDLYRRRNGKWVRYS